MPAVNRERKHNSNPMGKRKHWYLPCIAPALAALLLAGCGATVDLNEQATAETAMAVQWVPNGSVYTTAAEELEYWSTAQKLESALAATRETAPSVDLNELLDEFCAAQPGSFSLYLQNPATGESYTYNTDALYYPASLLKLPYAFWLCGQADAGTLDLEDELPNQFRGRLSDTALQAYNDAETIPAKAAMRAMIAHSDNNAVTLLTTHWPANESSGFQQFLADYGFAYAATCGLTPQTGIIGMASTGVHSNGFSLVRKVFDMTKESLDTYYDELGTTLGEALLAPTRIYVKALKSIKNAGVRVHACSHITGGGFYENIPRMLKDGTRAVVEKNSYPVLPIFKLLAEKGNIEEQMMYNTYNMGLGMVLAVDAADVDKTMEAIKAAGDTPYVVGRIEAGEKGVTLC